MTYEDLICALANEAPKLSGKSLKLLLCLIAEAIERGNSEVTVSKYWLSEKTGLSREGVTLASRDIEHIVPIEAMRGVSTTFTLPADWFAPQRSLFAIDSRLETKRQSPTNLATSRQETGRPVANFPGDSRPETRRQSPTFQATLTDFQATVAQKPGDSRQESWRPYTQNQQLTESPDSIDWIKGLSSTENLTNALDRLVAVDRVQKWQREEAEILRSEFADYRTHFGQHTLAKVPVDDKIVGRCLLIAPVDDLVATLHLMQEERIIPKPKNAWFVTLLLNKTHGIPPELTAERVRLRYERKQPPRSENLAFGTHLLNQAAAGTRFTH